MPGGRTSHALFTLAAQAVFLSSLLCPFLVPSLWAHSASVPPRPQLTAFNSSWGSTSGHPQRVCAGDARLLLLSAVPTMAPNSSTGPVLFFWIPVGPCQGRSR